MMKTTLIASVLLASVAVIPSFTSAAEQEEAIYGSQLMTQQERNEFRNKIRAAKTNEERERIRAENHKRMQERAKSQGLTLPDEPPAAGGGMGPGGGGMGPGGGGMGPGGAGMGPGGGRGR